MSKAQRAVEALREAADAYGALPKPVKGVVDMHMMTISMGDWEFDQCLVEMAKALETLIEVSREATDDAAD